MFIRKLKLEEASLLKDFPPENWYFDFEQFIAEHYGQEYFYACVAVEDDRIIGTGNTINSGKVGWLSNIIVIPEFQRRGVGTAVTDHLINHLVNLHCRTLLLIATSEGQRVYSSLGFKPVCDYYYFRLSDQLLEFPIADQIRKVRGTDYTELLKMDRVITGEDRGSLLTRYLESGWVFADRDKIRGYYISDFGRGLIIAEDAEAGISLLKFKHHLTDCKSAFPRLNEHALKFFHNHEFDYYHHCTRMYWGEKLSWNPQNIYSYGQGYWG